MANETVSIPTPVLQGSEKFKVRYRLLPSGSFTAYADKFTNTFILSGLSDGQYEIEIIFVSQDGTECDPAYYYFEVVPEFTCWDFVATQEEYPANSGLYRIRINFSGSTTPPCGWKIAVTPAGGSTSVYTYPTLPVSNTVNVAIAKNVVHRITITAQLCGTNEKECYTVDTTVVPTPPSCIGAVINDVQIIYNAVNQFVLFIEFTQSNPPTTTANIVYKQTGTPKVAGQPMDFGNFVQVGYIFGTGTAGRATIYIQLNPTTPNTLYYTYDIRFLDRCGNWLTASVAFG